MINGAVVVRLSIYNHAKITIIYYINRISFENSILNLIQDKIQISR